MAVTELDHAAGVHPARRRVSVLGATGSVGCSTVDLLERNPERFSVVALTAHRNVDRLAQQARALRPEIAVIGDSAHYPTLKTALAGTGIEIAAGARAVVEAAAIPADLVVAGIVGAAGLEPTLSAARQGTTVALANKECLVCAGDLLLSEVSRSGARLLPVDSEHNAIFQVFETENADDVERLILTASGGPFRTWSRDEMAAATPEQAVAHPNWDMGPKISVDSATLMNKGLELIEAAHLFPVSADRIEVLIHPQSVIHSMVGYIDGSVLAQLGSPDMRTPIAYALAWPDRMAAPSARLDLVRIGELTFLEPDGARFPALALARYALERGQGAPAVLNAANEVAVAAFLDGRAGFLDIARLVEAVLERVPGREIGSVDAFLELDAESRKVAESLVNSAS